MLCDAQDIAKPLGGLRTLRVYKPIEEDLLSKKYGAQEREPYGQAELKFLKFGRLG